VSGSLAPGFLVASPTLRCPFFHHTLVLLVDHGDEGSFGFVVNKPSPVDFGRVASELDLPIEERVPDVPVLKGGPVSPETGWIVFDPRTVESVPEDCIRLGEELAISASRTMLEELARRGETPPRALLTLGYSGWAKEQLEDEMREGSWIPVDLDPALIFERPIEERWESALASLGVEPGMVIGRKIALA